MAVMVSTDIDEEDGFRFRFRGGFHIAVARRGESSDLHLDPLDGSVLRCSIAYNKYGGFCIPLSSRHSSCAHKVLSGGVYESDTVKFLASHSGDGDIVHAGTYFGDFLPALSRSIGPDAKVWAFEPNNESYRCAFVTTCINDLKNVKLANMGLGDRKGFLTLMVSNAKGTALGGNSRILKWDKEAECYRDYNNVVITSDRTETIRIGKLDDVIPLDRMVSLIHLDVEGHEKQALIGALKTIQRCLPLIVLETVPTTYPGKRWLARNILCHGYRKDGMVNNNTIYRHG